MAYIDNEMKFALVINQRASPAILFNAIAHVAAGLGGMCPGSEYLNYPNDETSILARISRYPVIVLSAKNSSQISTFVASAHQQALSVNYFTTQMIDQSAEHQIRKNQIAAWKDLDFVCAVAFGQREVLDLLTKRFSLFK